MRPVLRRETVWLAFLSLLTIFGSIVSPDHLIAQVPAVKMVAPDKLSVRIYSRPATNSEIIGIALEGDILETVGAKGDFLEVRIPDKKTTGFVLKEQTIPWSPPSDSGVSPILLIGLLVVFLVAGGFGLYFIQARRRLEAAKDAASIPATIKRAEELYRTSDYIEAIVAFNKYLALHGGEVRNPDVYRRLAVCYQKTDDIREAVRNWEKMRSLAGLRRTEDYTLGVELMTALGKQAEAAEIYEQLLETDLDEDQMVEVHEKLFSTYRKLEEPEKLLNHALRLLEIRPMESRFLTDTVHFLISQGHTDLAVESGNKELIKTICEEFLGDKVVTQEAGRIYLKSLEYDRTDPRIHKMLADTYVREGDIRKAVSELTILHQLDRNQSDAYIEEAARLYVDNDRVSDAVAEGNPLIIKKIAQIFLSKSQVHSDAVAIYEKVLEFQPHAVGINKMLSTVYLTRGELDKYVAKLRVLHEIDGENHDYLTDLAICVVDNGLVEPTIQEGNPELNAKILKQLLKTGAQDTMTVALMEKLVEYEPDNVAARRSLIEAYENRGDHKQCFKHLLYLAELKPDHQRLIDKTGSFAVEHGVLEPILEQGSGKLLVATALELVKRKAKDPLSLEIMEAARNEHAKIDEYLLTLKKTKPGRRTRPRDKQVESVSTSPIEPQETREQKSTALPSEQTPDPERPELHPESSKLEIEPLSAEPEQPVRERPSEPEPAVPETSDASAAAQLIELMDIGKSSTAPVTTFVSSHAKGIKLTHYNPNELFVPATGGLAYKDTAVLLIDGWGNLCFGIEVKTGRNVLMRVFRKDLLEPNALDDFLRAIADVGFNLVHNNILRVEDRVSGPGGIQAIIYPYLAITLEQLIQSEKRPEFRVLQAMVYKIIDAIAFAHQYKGLDGRLRRTFHLHLQPAHILLSEDFKDCRVMGLGYSQMFRSLSGARQPRWQDPGMNPATMPPEFFAGRSGIIKEKAAEIYSLGILTYFIVTGEYPFPGPTLSEYKLQHRTVHVTPPTLVNPLVPDWLEAIIVKCLEKDPEKRWQSVTDIQQVFLEGMRTS